MSMTTRTGDKRLLGLCRFSVPLLLRPQMATGRPGRVGGSSEKSLARLPYIIAYELRDMEGRESVVIVRVIHTSRDWPAEEWPH